MGQLWGVRDVGGELDGGFGGGVRDGLAARRLDGFGGRFRGREAGAFGAWTGREAYPTCVRNWD